VHHISSRFVRRLVALLLGAGLLGLSPRTTRAGEPALAPGSPPLRTSLAAPAPLRTIPVDGVALAVHDSDPEGGKPALVCLHAIGQGGGDFAAFARAFDDRFRVVVVDWPGHGASGDDRAPASAARYEVLLRGLLDALRIESAVIFGNSIGGATALAFAQRSPERVRALILCNPGGLDPGGLVAGLFIRRLVSRFERGVRGDPRFLDWYAAYYEDVLVGPEAVPRRDRIVAAGYESAPRLVEAWTSFATPEADLRAGLPALRVPVFVGWAMRDGLVQWSRNRAALKTLPNVTLVRFERSGHAPFLEEPASFNAALAPFLDALP
jgi:pimeloyl-ACP methyl ester carboxylesterase